MVTIKGIKVGTTDITSVYSSESDTKSFDVTPVSITSISKPDDVVYNGNSFEPIPVVMAVVDGNAVTLISGTDYTLSYSNNTNVGTATVTATGKGNYTGTLSETWNITSATITVASNDQSYTYDGNLHGTGISVTTVNNQPYTVRYRKTSSGEYNLTSAPTFRDVINSGYNNVVYYQVTANNHTTYEGSYQLQICPKKAELSWGELNWMYDGNSHQTTCTVSNLVSGDACTVTLYNNLITEVGEITVTAISLSNSNYSLPTDSTVSITITITPGLFIKLSGTWTPVKAVYKKVGNSWTLQAMDVAFDTSQAYVKVD
jgi:hypothetical protein